MRESTFQNKIIRKLKSYPECYIVKIWGGGFQTAGVPDLLVCYKGVFIGIELKNEIGKPSPLQLVHLSNIMRAKGKGLVLRPQNENELWDLLKSIDDEQRAEDSRR